MQFYDDEYNDSIDYYYENGIYAVTENRSVIHDRGYIHYTIHCWVYTNTINGIFVLFQKRSQNKRLFPQKYDVAAAGHYLSGEFGKDGLRELVEELKEPLSRYQIDYFKTVEVWYSDSSINNHEICNVYLCGLEGFNIERLEYDPNEIDDLIVGEVNNFVALLRGNRKSIPVYSCNKKQSINVVLEEFIIAYKDYFLDVLEEVQRKAVKGIIKKRKLYTFAMLKPDTLRRNLVPEIISYINEQGFTVELFNVVLVNEELIFKHYANKIDEEGPVFKVKAAKTFSNQYVVPLVISSNSKSIISDFRRLVGFKDPVYADKTSIRGRWGIDTMDISEKEMRCCDNLIHASDSYDSFRRELFLWFKRKDVEYTVMTNFDKPI